MPPYEHLHIGQAHAFPRHVLPAHAAEGLKDFGDILCGNTTPIVADSKDGDLGLACTRDDDLAGAVGFKVGHGIRQEIPHDLFHGGTIGHHSRESVNRHLHLTRGDLVCEGHCQVNAKNCTSVQ